MIEILTVCTGNVCRSALADVLLRARLADIGATVSSAGTYALAGEPLTPQTAQLAHANGARADDVSAHRARQLSERMLTSPELALAMTRDHRRRMVELAPALLKRAFTLREFARLAEGMTDGEITDAAATGGDDPKQRLRTALRTLANRRGVVGPPPDASADDVVDPYRRGQEVYDLQASQLVPAVDEVARFVRASIAG